MLRGLFASRQRTASSTVVVAGLSGVLVLALSAAGTPGTQAELNDGGVWVTNSAGSEFGRFIKAIRQQDTPVSIDSTDFDVQQSGSRVLIVDAPTASVRIVDPASTSASAPVSFKTEVAGAPIMDSSSARMLTFTPSPAATPVTLF